MKKITSIFIVLCFYVSALYSQNRYVYADSLNGEHTIYISNNKIGMIVYKLYWQNQASNEQYSNFKKELIDSVEFAIRFIKNPYKDPKLNTIKEKSVIVKKEIITKAMKSNGMNDINALNEIKSKYKLSDDQLNACLYSAILDRENISIK